MRPSLKCLSALCCGAAIPLPDCTVLRGHSDFACLHCDAEPFCLCPTALWCRVILCLSICTMLRDLIFFSLSALCCGYIEFHCLWSSCHERQSYLCGVHCILVGFLSSDVLAAFGLIWWSAARGGSVAYMVYLPEIRLIGSARLMYNLLKMMVIADSAGDASWVCIHAYLKAYSECRI